MYIALLYIHKTHQYQCIPEWYASKQSEKMAAIENERVNCLLRVSEKSKVHTPNAHHEHNGNWRAPRNV